ncbi:hypothetical protein RvY_09657 [Ramazzottius varieornatus]|uniref:Methyltransferase-like protein 22 n=1 Tax=Ramazzottius varieornatus TaxID=947166 RepID=A0A1D1VHZ5_RAMVA|nr:hypothetical protein RvY_09657 [Ramazzottius varieornatus]
MDSDYEGCHEEACHESSGVSLRSPDGWTCGGFVPLKSNEYVLSDVHLLCEEDAAGDSDFVTSRFVFTVPSRPSFPSAWVVSCNLSPSPTVSEEGFGSANDVDDDGDCDIRRETPAREVIVIEHKRSTVLEDVGSQVWRGALYLSDFILDRPEIFRGRVVLELGVGVGLTLSVLQYAGCRCVFGTDYSEHILEQCQLNVDRNSQLLPRCIALPRKECPRSDVRIRILDWCSKETLPGYRTSRLFESTKFNLENSKFRWSPEDLLLLQNDCVIVAADVIYSDSLTDAFFDTLLRLLGLVEVAQLTVYIALEKRINFTMAEMAACAPSYQYFLRCLEKFSARSAGKDGPFLPAEMVATGADSGIKQYFQYERVPELEMWKLTVERR